MKSTWHRTTVEYLTNAEELLNEGTSHDLPDAAVWASMANAAALSSIAVAVDRLGEYLSDVNKTLGWRP